MFVVSMLLFFIADQGLLSSAPILDSTPPSSDLDDEELIERYQLCTHHRIIEVCHEIIEANVGEDEIVMEEMLDGVIHIFHQSGTHTRTQSHARNLFESIHV